MNRHRLFVLLATLSLSTLATGAVGCSKASSPTEPAFDLDEPSVAASSSSVTGEKRRGRGGDDPTGDDRGRGNGGNDDRRGSNRRGRGGNDRQNDDRQRPPRAGAEFEGAVTSVNGGTITLAGGTRVAVNGQTQWSARGDLFTLSQVAGSVASGDPTRVEGRGVRQGDGSFLAQTIKAEVDN